MCLRVFVSDAMAVIEQAGHGMWYPLWSHQGQKVDRKRLERFVKLLCCFPSNVSWLKPWLSHFFPILFALATKLKSLDSDLVVGWRCLGVGSKKHQGGSAIVEALAKKFTLDLTCW